MTPTRCGFLFACVLLARPAAAEPAPAPPAVGSIDPAAAAKVSFTRDIKPVLMNRCIECHAGTKPKSELVVKTVAALLKGGKKVGPAVIPGKPDESPIVQFVTGARKPRMPKEGPGLTDDEVNLLRQWIAAGAKDDAAAAAAESAVGATPGAQKPPSGEGGSGRDPRTSGPEVPPTAIPWEPSIDWPAAEKFAVRRYLRLALLPPPPAVPGDAAGAEGRGQKAPPTQASPTANPIDAFIVSKWPSAPKGPEPELCDDSPFVRRAFLDVIGAVPTAKEAGDFCADKAPDKRAKLVDALLARSADYAAHWVPFWEDALCSNGSHQGGVGTRGNYRKWVYENFLANKPYDVMVAELIDPAMPNHPERFVLNNEHMKTLKTAADAAQVFLGTSLKCASCHSHFLNKEWPQARAAAYAGFYSPQDLELIRCEKKTGEFIETKFPFDLPGAPAAAPKDYDARLHLVAELITDPTNPRFAKTIVNRLWRRYLGLGLFEPADDFRLDQPPSHPELLDWLADDFLRHGCDLKHTIRLIMTSRTYQLAYNPALEDRFDVEKPAAPRWYRSPTLRRLTAEQLLDSIRAATEQKLDPAARMYMNDNSTPLTRSLGRPSTRNETSTSRPDDVAVVQSLEFMNGPDYNDRIYKGALAGMLAAEKDAAKRVERAYWSVLSRAPTEKEREAGVGFLKPAVGATLGAQKPPSGEGGSSRDPGQSGSETPPTPAETVWLDDDLPSGATTQGEWQWGEAPKFPVFSGMKSHRQGGPPGGRQQHYFQVPAGKSAMTVAAGDVLYVYASLAGGKHAPREIMVQWLQGGSWDHRASWGEDLIQLGAHKAMGPLPKTGEWVRLDVPLDAVGLKAGSIEGISFDQFDGRVTWDKAGVVKHDTVVPSVALVDMIWALFTGPEFQYVR